MASSFVSIAIQQQTSITAFADRDNVNTNQHVNLIKHQSNDISLFVNANSGGNTGSGP